MDSILTLCVFFGNFCVVCFVFEVLFSRLEQYSNECVKYSGNYFAFGFTLIGWVDTQLKTALTVSLIYKLF